MLTTSTGGVWALQALLGVERMPTPLRLKPFIPSAHGDLVVETTAGRQPLQSTAEYHDLVRIGVVDDRGRVDDVVRDWMVVLSRAEREVMLTIRRPGPPPVNDETGPTVCERVLVVCRYQRYLAMAARDGDQVVIGGVSDTTDPHAQSAAICDMVLAALGDHPPADIGGVNVPKDLIDREIAAAAGNAEAVRTALARCGLSPWEVEVVAAAAALDTSAMGVVAVIDHGARMQVHPRVLTVADTAHGRISLTTTTGADGTGWVSIFPATPTSLRQSLTDLLAAPQLV